MGTPGWTKVDSGVKLLVNFRKFRTGPLTVWSWPFSRVPKQPQKIYIKSGENPRNLGHVGPLINKNCLNKINILTTGKNFDFRNGCFFTSREEINLSTKQETNRERFLQKQKITGSRPQFLQNVKLPKLPNIYT